ncbi:MAG: metallophosphoesterase [Candidatus Taylorbacteria bacterium]|nr:metallophosphoesterase [Candidatus Taylorbacteria bacterium]
MHQFLKQRLAWYRAWHNNPRYTFWNFVILAAVGVGIATALTATSYRLSVELNSGLNPVKKSVRVTATAPNLKIAIFGDQGLNDNTKAVLKLVRDEGAEAIIHTGDLDYIDSPDLWDKITTEILGADFPLFVALGNHELKKFAEYETKVRERLERVKSAECTGEIPRKMACHYKGLYIIVVTPGVVDAGHEFFISDKITKDSSLWTVCAWHKNQKRMQVTSASARDETGFAVYEECLKGGGIVATGHNHVYARTHLMESFEKGELALKETPLKISKGRSLNVISGLGGKSIVEHGFRQKIWAKVYSKTEDAAFGALFCTFNIRNRPELANCYFKNIDGEIIDSFELQSQIRD